MSENMIPELTLNPTRRPQRRRSRADPGAASPPPQLRA